MIADAPLRRFDGRAMASPLRLTVASDVPDRLAVAAWDAVVDEFEAAEQAMSRFRESSELTVLNRAMVGDAGPVLLGSRLRHALVAADRAWRLTGGRFDPRVLRALDTLGYRGAALDGPGGSGPGGTAPSGRPVVDLRRDGTIRTSGPIDLGGIGKGLTLRWAAARVAAILPTGATALLEAGGDIVTIGRRAARDPWLVGVEDPGDLGEELAVVALDAGAIATSSVAVNRWVGADGRPAHHLVDPRTGQPGGGGLLAVTVAGPDPAWTEVRSKWLFLEGRRAIGPQARHLGLPVWWVADDGTLEMTPAARERTAWLAREAGMRPVPVGTVASPGGSPAVDAI